MISAEQYNKCVEHYGAGMLRFAIQRVQSKEEAQCLVQDTFEIFWKKRVFFNDSNLQALLYNILDKKIKDSWRKSGRSTDLEVAGEIAVEQENTDIKRLVQQAMQRINERYRNILELRDILGYSYEEIGQMENMNESQVKVTIFRARKALKEMILELEPKI